MPISLATTTSAQPPRWRKIYSIVHGNLMLGHNIFPISLQRKRSRSYIVQTKKNMVWCCTKQHYHQYSFFLYIKLSPHFVHLKLSKNLKKKKIHFKLQQIQFKPLKQIQINQRLKEESSTCIFFTTCSTWSALFHFSGKYVSKLSTLNLLILMHVIYLWGDDVYMFVWI